MSDDYDDIESNIVYYVLNVCFVYCGYKKNILFVYYSVYCTSYAEFC